MTNAAGSRYSCLELWLRRKRYYTRRDFFFSLFFVLLIQASMGHVIGSNDVHRVFIIVFVVVSEAGGWSSSRIESITLGVEWRIKICSKTGRGNKIFNSSNSGNKIFNSSSSGKNFLFAIPGGFCSCWGERSRVRHPDFRPEIEKIE